jgi:hypothetical protein
MPKDWHKKVLLFVKGRKVFLWTEKKIHERFWGSWYHSIINPCHSRYSFFKNNFSHLKISIYNSNSTEKAITNTETLFMSGNAALSADVQILCSFGSPIHSTSSCSLRKTSSLFKIIHVKYLFQAYMSPRTYVPDTHFSPTHTFPRHTLVSNTHMHPTHTCTRHILAPDTHMHPSTLAPNTLAPDTHMYPTHTCIRHTHVPDTHFKIFQKSSKISKFLVNPTHFSPY